MDRVRLGFAVGAPLMSACSGPTPDELRSARAVELGFFTAHVEQRKDCRIAGALEGESTATPPFDARCARGPDRKCTLAREASSVWEYEFPGDDPAWKDWASLGYEAPATTYFHKTFSWAVVSEGCRITLSAFADLDGDGVYSTYESVETYANGRSIGLTVNEANVEE